MNYYNSANFNLTLKRDDTRCLAEKCVCVKYTTAKIDIILASRYVSPVKCDIQFPAYHLYHSKLSETKVGYTEGSILMAVNSK